MTKQQQKELEIIKQIPYNPNRKVEIKKENKLDVKTIFPKNFKYFWDFTEEDRLELYTNIRNAYK